jgi:hypothetical protein
MQTPTDIFAEISEFCKATGTSWSAFGVAVAKDPNLVFDIKDGREPRRATLLKIREHLNSTNGDS